MSKKTIFKPKSTHSSPRSLDQFLPDEAVGLPEAVFEDLIGEEAISEAIEEARKHRYGTEDRTQSHSTEFSDRTNWI